MTGAKAMMWASDGDGEAARRPVSGGEEAGREGGGEV